MDLENREEHKQQFVPKILYLGTNNNIYSVSSCGFELDNTGATQFLATSTLIVMTLPPCAIIYSSHYMSMFFGSLLLILFILTDLVSYFIMILFIL